MDCSGIIVDIGSDVERFKIGDSVYGTLGVKGGAFAEYVRDDEVTFALKPANLNYAEAAAIPTACLTSYQALFERLKCTEDTKILICGGPSATGLYAIQLAKSVGALVATTASPRNTELIKKLGKYDFSPSFPQCFILFGLAQVHHQALIMTVVLLQSESNFDELCKVKNASEFDSGIVF